MENQNNKNGFISEEGLSVKTILITDVNKLNSNNISFLTNHTQIAKGVASLMLLYHHLFLPGSKINKNFINEFLIYGIDFRKYSAIFFKITTCTYTFLSGLGLYYSLIKFKNIKDMYKKCFKNFFRLMIIFWIILLFFFHIGVKQGLFNLKYTTIISCIFADFHRKGSWWYVKMHFALLIYSPLFIRLFQNVNYKKKFIPIIVFYLIYSTVKIIKISFKFEGMINIIFHYFRYFSYIDIILSFLSGIIIAKYNIMSNFNNNKYECFYYCLFSIISSIFIRCNLISNPGDTKIDFFIVPLFILPIRILFLKMFNISLLLCEF